MCGPCAPAHCNSTMGQGLRELKPPPSPPPSPLHPVPEGLAPHCRNCARPHCRNCSQPSLPRDYLRLIHDTDPAPWYQPAGHGDGAADPLTQKLPGGQAPVQLAFVMDSAPPNRPAGQLAGVTEPASQYDPTGHGRMHSSGRPNVSLNLPAGQALQLAAPPRLNLPCGH